MKDLYAELRVEPDAGKDRIAAAVEEKPDAAEYTAILLDPDKRADYDRVRATLKSIAELRFRLSLPNNNAWYRKHYPEFKRWRESQVEDEPEQTLDAAVSDAAAGASSDGFRGFNIAPELIVIFSAVIVAGAFALYLYMR